MVPWACHNLHAYRDGPTMVDCAGGYYGAEFQGFWGTTQGDPLNPTIFNMVAE